jgi:predicted CXXCH cytochrome family protein
MDNLIPTDFTHKESGVHYRIYSESGHAWLSFDRDGENAVHGKRQLLYFIGSGQSRGLTYLFADDGFLFESPINWYTARRAWNMTPAYQYDREIPLNLPVYTSCLHCHVSGMRPPVEGSDNRYAMPVLSHSGISCERCHGPGAAHLQGGSIVNPAKLTPERRDGICMQCHLEGRVSVERRGRHIYDFQPGESLSDYVRYYVMPTSAVSSLGAVSQVEALAQSTCKKMSGDKMSCTSCHDPHFSPQSQERVSYYREKCLACHSAAFGAKHHPNQPDCTSCHMPASLSKDVAHTEVTDHRILRRPQVLSMQEAKGQPAPALVPFPDTLEAENDVRSFALAWEMLANTGVESARPKADAMLRQALAKFPNDPALLSALGYEEQRHGSSAAARELYQKTLAVDPNSNDAASNLAVIEAQAGSLARAVELWRGVFERNPGSSAVGLNLARMLCMSGRIADSRAAVARVLEFNPDMSPARKLQRQLEQTNPKCE